MIMQDEHFRKLSASHCNDYMETLQPAPQIPMKLCEYIHYPNNYMNKIWAPDIVWLPCYRTLEMHNFCSTI